MAIHGMLNKYLGNALEFHLVTTSWKGAKKNPVRLSVKKTEGCQHLRLNSACGPRTVAIKAVTGQHERGPVVKRTLFSRLFSLPVSLPVSLVYSSSYVSGSCGTPRFVANFTSFKRENVTVKS